MNIEDILQNRVVAIYFSSPDCQVCGALKPKLFNSLTNKFANLKIFSVDVSKNPEISAQFSVFSVPTILIFFEGKEFIRKSRSFSIDGLLQEMQRPYNIMFG